LLMLWWFVGVWLASGLMIPVLWLASTACRGVFGRVTKAGQMPAVFAPRSAAIVVSTVHRWLTSSLTTGRPFKRSGHRRDGEPVIPTMSRMGHYVLAGMMSFGALILLFISSFSDSGAPTRDLSSASAVVQAPMTQATAVATKHDPATLAEAEPAALLQPRDGGVGNGADEDDGGQTAAIAPPEPAVEALLTTPVYPKSPGPERGAVHRRAHEPLVRTYVTPSSRGIWLFPPTANAGGNS
jgi:hypothetical protein